MNVKDIYSLLNIIKASEVLAFTLFLSPNLLIRSQVLY